MQKPKTLQQAIRYFSNEQVCIDTVAAMRWPNGPVCPKCEHREHYYLATQKRWKCKKCGKQFSVKAGTVFEDSALSLDKWLVALWMLVNCKNGVSSYEVHRALGITQKSAWFVLHRLRLALQQHRTERMGGTQREVEADETFVDGAAGFMHIDKRRRRNITTGPGDKAAVFGLLERGGEVRATVIPNRRRKPVQAEIRKHVQEGTPVYTDAFMSCVGLKPHYLHGVIDHAHSYAAGRVHTNGLEKFWSLLKRGIKGSYVSVEPFHLFRYVDEQVFRYDNRATKERQISDGDRFSLALSQIAGKRLTFTEVTGKVGQSAA